MSPTTMSGVQSSRCAQWWRLGSKNTESSRLAGAGPRDQRDQQNTATMLAQPESQRVLFVADEIAALALFAAARPGVGPAGTILAPFVFLYALVAAGRSVESIKATVLAKP